MKVNLNHVFKTLEGEDIITPKRVTKDGNVANSSPFGVI